MSAYYHKMVGIRTSGTISLANHFDARGSWRCTDWNCGCEPSNHVSEQSRGSQKTSRYESVES